MKHRLKGCCEGVKFLKSSQFKVSTINFVKNT